MVVAVVKVDKASQPSETWSLEYVLSPKVTTRTIDKVLTPFELILRAYTQGLGTTSGKGKKVEIDSNRHQLALFIRGTVFRQFKEHPHKRPKDRRALKLPLLVQVVCHFHVA